MDTPIPNLLRPEQVMNTQDEVRRLDGMLSDPRAQLEDPMMARRQLASMQHVLETQTPTEYAPADKDNAVRRELALREHMVTDGMPTQAEMRKAPPGAVNKLMTWESRNKKHLQEWKYLTMRLHAGSTDPDLANFERYRPVGGAQEMSMDNAQIAGKSYKLPPPGAELPVIMSDAEKEALQRHSPEISNMMALATNGQRTQILKAVQDIMAEEAKSNVAPENKRPKQELTPDERKARGARLSEGRAKAKAERELEAAMTADALKE